MVGRASTLQGMCKEKEAGIASDKLVSFKLPRRQCAQSMMSMVLALDRRTPSRSRIVGFAARNDPAPHLRGHRVPDAHMLKILADFLVSRLAACASVAASQHAGRRHALLPQRDRPVVMITETDARELFPAIDKLPPHT